MQHGTLGLRASCSPSSQIHPCGHWKTWGCFSCKRQNQDPDPKGSRAGLLCPSSLWPPGIELQNPSGHSGYSIRLYPEVFSHFFSPRFFRPYLFGVSK